MGEAKMKAVTKAAVKEMHLSRREQFQLAVFLLTRVTTKNRQERRKHEAAIQELDMDTIADRAEAGENVNLNEVYGDKVDLDAPYMKAEITGGTLDFLLEKLDVEQAGGMSRLYLRIEERLLAVKENRYDLPEDVPATSVTPAPEDVEVAKAPEAS